MVELELTKKEKDLLFEKIARQAIGSGVWDTFVGNKDAGDITKAWNKIMVFIYGTNWEERAKDFKTL